MPTPLITITLRLRPELYQAMQRCAQPNNRSINAEIVAILESFAAKEESKTVLPSPEGLKRKA